MQSDRQILIEMLDRAKIKWEELAWATRTKAISVHSEGMAAASIFYFNEEDDSLLNLEASE